MPDPTTEDEWVDGAYLEPAVDDEEVSDQEWEETPRIPTLDDLPAVVDYSVRRPGDWVMSGPIRGGPGRGQVFETKKRAYQAMCLKYGVDRVLGWDPGLEGRWAFLIRK